MPSNRKHSEHTLKELGKAASDLHCWMDKPSEKYGYLHRIFNHDLNDLPKWAIEKYGYQLAYDIMEDHIKLDQYDERLFGLLKYVLTESRKKD